MTRKVRRRNKAQGADLEAQPEDEGVCITTYFALPAHLSLQRGRMEGGSTNEYAHV